MKRSVYHLTFRDGFVSETHEVPREAVRALIRYLRRHAHMPFVIAGGIFLRHWKMGVNLMSLPDPRAQVPLTTGVERTVVDGWKAKFIDYNDVWEFDRTTDKGITKFDKPKENPIPTHPYLVRVGGGYWAFEKRHAAIALRNQP